ncbi:MAG: chemotaxis protein CheW [Gemmatimonadaceae bacterium]|nr:chemotaxis protein CheW [Gemmatimonadaceae bacterium]
MRNLLLFRVGASRFAAPLETVEEALDIDAAAVQGIPGENSALRGVFPLRGALVPLYDPRRALGMAMNAGATAMVIRPPGSSARVALAVDDVEDLLDDVQEGDIRPPGGGDLDGIVRGVVQRAAGIIVLVDLYALVAACRATDGGDRA